MVTFGKPWKKPRRHLVRLVVSLTSFCCCRYRKETRGQSEASPVVLPGDKPCIYVVNLIYRPHTLFSISVFKKLRIKERLNSSCWHNYDMTYLVSKYLWLDVIITDNNAEQETFALWFTNESNFPKKTACLWQAAYLKLLGCDKLLRPAPRLFICCWFIKVLVSKLFPVIKQRYVNWCE